MAELKPAYLISGDDAVRIDAWRARLRARAQAQDTEATVEVLEGERLSADAIVEALSALTLGVGPRFVLADGVQRWKEREAKVVGAALGDLPANTIAVFVAEGDPPKALATAVERCGGELRSYKGPGRSEYSQWVRDRGRELGLELDADAAELLVARIGEDDKRRFRQQRIERELEKMATYAGGDATLVVEDVERLASNAVESRAWDLADAVVEGNASGALEIAEELRARGEDVMHILFALLRQLRNCRRTLAIVSSGGSVGDVGSQLRVPPFIARRFIAQARGADGERLERAIDVLADLDYAVRGAGRLDIDSALTLALTRAAGGGNVLAAPET